MPRTELRRELVDAVLSQRKTAAASLREQYEPHTSDPLPTVGEHYALLGFTNEPVGLVEITEVTVVSAGSVDLRFVLDEGEGFESLAEWRVAQERQWAPRVIDDTTEFVCERFRLVSQG